MDMPDKGMILFMDRMEQEDTRFHHANSQRREFKTDELIISWISHLTFPDHGWPQVAKTMESKAMDTGALVYLQKPDIVY